MGAASRRSGEDHHRQGVEVSNCFPKPSRPIANPTRYRSDTHSTSHHKPWLWCIGRVSRTDRMRQFCWIDGPGITTGN